MSDCRVKLDKGFQKVMVWCPLFVLISVLFVVASNVLEVSLC